MPGAIAAADFEGREGEIFTIMDGDVRLDVELVDYTTHAGGASIIFRGPSEPVLPQGTYVIEHAFLDVFEIFIVPIGPDGAGMRYEAVFN